ncbi:glycosyltransferase family A protein [Alisedimentitalea sp. MJ-SS2]|uniref:glycosyltransferase family 2 protein n=1 Tax=Aliisedimentitalea sp. MJ-SS2 TaxID=3049795 RepID=UPI002913A3C2|nr:glycosyltransferase family A protein [Alisedimentitalea sp. MJ-SS2]MDU8930016.1 glycosyltransferase family A protein [Alisedimentitalea sp. MJ-SS2]
MLSFALITHDEGPRLRRSLAALERGLLPDEDLTVFDLGSTDDTLPELASFMGPRAGELIRLTRPDLSRSEAITLARDVARHPYLLVLDGCDLLISEALDGLRRVLAQEPQAVVLNRGWGLGGVDAILPAPDAARMATLGSDPDCGALMTLTPDPDRLLIHAGLAGKLAKELACEACASGTPAQDWALWQQILTRAESVALHPETLWISPLPARPVAPVFTAIAASPAPVEEIGRMLSWAEDALIFAAPDEAPALLQAAQEMLAALSPEHVAALPDTAPLVPLLAALTRDDTALALTHIALLLAAQERRRNDALCAALAGLRHDLDLALPGPAYLRDLYDRIRAR